MKILVTGANGFVGKILCERLMSKGHHVRAAVRRAGVAPQGAVEFVVGSLGADTDWVDALEGVEAVIHLAARVHVMSGTAADDLTAFRSANAEGTIRLAQQAEEAGVRSFIFMSSIKVNGEGGEELVYDAHSSVHPVGPYASSKWEAEQGLLRLAEKGNLTVFNVRTPMIYGPGVRGNLERMIRLVDSGLPVPFSGLTKNQRTLISVWNLASLLEYCAVSRQLDSCTILAGDDTSPSTFDLYSALARAMNKPARSFYLPVLLMLFLGKASGRGKELSRLTGSLKVRTSATCEHFDWRPELGFAEAISRMAMSSAGRDR